MKERYTVGELIHCKNGPEVRSTLEALSKKGYHAACCHWQWIRITAVPKNASNTEERI